MNIIRLSSRPHTLALGAIAASLLGGCGGSQQDFGGFSRGLGGDVGNSYNSSISNQYYGRDGAGDPNAVNRGTFPMIETSFTLKDVKGDPFDFEQVSVLVTLRKPDGGKLDVPAFFDGADTWRMRFTPTAQGKYSVVEVKLNKDTAREEKLEPKEWDVRGEPKAGFVRVDRGDKARFVFDNGSRYYPIGHNQAWHSQNYPEIAELFGKMNAAGENWSRVWMNHWDGKNLDWSASDKKLKAGELDLEVAKKWDALLQAAEKQGIYFQMVLQHHGQYSSQKGYKFSNNNNANWEANPYNAKNGGFLQNPEDFFSDPKARKMTKRKLYYILARWGYSPNVLAWELFNEVEGTDAGSGKLWENIALWHREMALFIRQFDGYHHLLTTSAHAGIPLDSPIWETVDYTQSHLYPPDIITSIGAEPEGLKKTAKPHFVGEFGAMGLQDPQGVALHNGLWASLLRSPSGAAQYWDWEAVEKNNLYSHFQAFSNFITASSFANQGSLLPAVLPTESSQKTALRFAPGAGWETAKQNEFVVSAGGVPSGFDRYPSFLQGKAHRDMTPKPLTLQVNYPAQGTFSLRIGQVSKGGAKVVITADGKSVEREFPAGEKDYKPAEDVALLQIAVPAGAKTVTVENTGADWVVLQRLELSDYANALAAQGRIGKEYLAAWLYHRGNVETADDKGLTPVTGRINVQGLKTGRYRVGWFDTRTGKPMEESSITVAKEKEPTWLSTPPVTRDAALYLTRDGKTGKGDKDPKRNGDKKPNGSAPSSPTNERPRGEN